MCFLSALIGNPAARSKDLRKRRNLRDRRRIGTSWDLSHPGCAAGKCIWRKVKANRGDYVRACRNGRGYDAVACRTDVDKNGKLAGWSHSATGGMRGDVHIDRDDPRADFSRSKQAGRVAFIGGLLSR